MFSSLVSAYWVAVSHVSVALTKEARKESKRNVRRCKRLIQDYAESIGMEVCFRSGSIQLRPPADDNELRRMAIKAMVR